MEKPGLLILGIVVVVFATAILSSVLTVTTLGVVMDSGMIEQKIVAGLQEEITGLTIDCNSTYVEQATAISIKGEKLYCTISQNP